MKKLNENSIAFWSAVFVLVITLASFALSFTAIQDFAVRKVGVPYGLSFLVPVIVGGMILVMALSVLRAKLFSESSWIAMGMILVGTAVSIAFNLFHNESFDMYTISYSVIVPSFLAISFHVLMGQVEGMMERGNKIRSLQDLNNRLNELKQSILERRAEDTKKRETIAKLETKEDELNETIKALETEIKALRNERKKIAPKKPKTAKKDVLIEFLKANPRASYQEVADGLKMSKSTVYNRIQKLEGVRQVPNGSGQVWEVGE